MIPHLEVTPAPEREHLDAPVLPPVTITRSRSMFFGHPVEHIEVRGGCCSGKSVLADALARHLGDRGHTVVVFDTAQKAREASPEAWRGRYIDTVIACSDQ